MLKSWVLSVFFLILSILFKIILTPIPSGLLLSGTVKIITRVADVRTSRGDLDGASRARYMAHKLEALRDLSGGDTEKLPEVRALRDALGDLAGLGSNAERLDWVKINYCRICNTIKFLMRKFREGAPGEWSETVDIMHKEVRECRLLKDCLDLLAGDVQALTQFLRAFTLPQTASAAQALCALVAGLIIYALRPIFTVSPGISTEQVRRDPPLRVYGV